MFILCESLLKYNIKHDDKIRLYALYKQAISGDCPLQATDSIDAEDLSTATRYSAAWKSLKGKSKYEAMEDYIELVRSIIDSQSYE
jgi:acyl-CoA-binding protein